MSALLLKLADDAMVRGTTTGDGMQVFSVYDFINQVCRKSESYTRKAWSHLISEDSNFKDEIESLFCTVTLRHGGQPTSYHTPARPLTGLQRLLLILDNKVAVDFRQSVEDIFVRFTEGDISMIYEIHMNTASSVPVHQAYRQALVQQPVTDTAHVKRMLDHDEALFNLELHERYMTLHERSWALYEKSLALQRRT